MYNPFSLENKTILVTGASSGIGKAIAIECAKLGADLVINGRNEERLKSTFDDLDTSLGQQHQMIVADLTTDEGLEQLISKKIAFDGVSSNAGIVTGNKPIKFIETDDLLNVINTNTISHITLANNCLRRSF